MIADTRANKTYWYIATAQHSTAQHISIQYNTKRTRKARPHHNTSRTGRSNEAAVDSTWGSPCIKKQEAKHMQTTHKKTRSKTHADHTHTSHRSKNRSPITQVEERGTTDAARSASLPCPLPPFQGTRPPTLAASASPGQPKLHLWSRQRLAREAGAPEPGAETKRG